MWPLGESGAVATKNIRCLAIQAASSVSIFSSCLPIVWGWSLRIFSCDERDREAVIALAADGLDCRGAHAPLSGEQFVEATHALDKWIAAGGVGHRSAATDMAGDNQGPATGKLEHPREILRIAFLVRVNEDQIEGAATRGGELRQRVQRSPKAQFNHAGQPRARDVAAGDFSVFGIVLQCDQPAIDRKSVV